MEKIKNVCARSTFFLGRKKEFVRGCRIIVLMQSIERKIFVDADSCPVRKEVLLVSREFDVVPVFVSSYAHVPNMKEERSNYVIVDKEKEAVDLYIANHVRANDIVITNDYALAFLALMKKAIVLSPRGKNMTESNIRFLLDVRHDQRKLRRSGGRTKGPKAMKKEDRVHFYQKLRKLFMT